MENGSNYTDRVSKIFQRINDIQVYFKIIAKLC